jgi:AcrR family transcriptional regulator
MTPRAYDMSTRARAREETRRRIVAATIELHTEKGILGTSWKDIAERADVAIGTVYNHFPSLDELVPACGELLMQRLEPPEPERASQVVGDASRTRERLERVARELFAFYERGGSHLEVFPGERDLPAMREWEVYQRATVEAYVRAAIGSRRSERTVQLVSALFDLGTFRSLAARGIGLEEAVRTMARAAECALERRSKGATR